MPENIFSSHNNFSAGELTPTIKGRTDLQLYQNGAETLLNFLVLPSGGITRRPGTQYIHLFEQHRTRVFAGLNFNTTLNFLVVFEVVNRKESILGIHVFFNDKPIDYFTVNDILLNPETFSFVSYQGKLYVCFGLDYPIYVLRPNDQYIIEQSEQIGRQLEQENIVIDRKFVFETHACHVRYYTDHALNDFRNAQLRTKDKIREDARKAKQKVEEHYENRSLQITFKNQYNQTIFGQEFIYADEEENENPWPLNQIKEDEEQDNKTYFEGEELKRKPFEFDLDDEFASASLEWHVRLKTIDRIRLKLEVVNDEGEITATEIMPSLKNNKYHTISVKGIYIRPKDKVHLSIVNPASNEDHQNRVYIDSLKYTLSLTKKLYSDRELTDLITAEHQMASPKFIVKGYFELQDRMIINTISQTISPQLFFFKSSLESEKEYYPAQQNADYLEKKYMANKFVLHKDGEYTLYQVENLGMEDKHDPTNEAKAKFIKEITDTIDKRRDEDLENYLYSEEVATRRLAVHDIISGIEPDKINDTLKAFDQIVEQDVIHCNSIALYNNRLWTFGTRDNIHAVYVSGMGDFNNFDMTYKNLLDVKNPLNPFYVVFNSRTSDPVLWSIPFAGELLIGTTDGIYSIKEGKREHGEFIKVQKEIDIALSEIQPVTLAKSIFIVEKGNQKIHNLNFSKEKGGFQLFDVTAYAEHLFTRKILAMTGLTSPFPMLFVQTGDRNFKVLSFDYDLKIFGWSQHLLGGQGSIHAMMAHNNDVWFYVLRLPQQRHMKIACHVEKLTLANAPEKVPYVDAYSQIATHKDQPKKYRAIEDIAAKLKQTIDVDFQDNINAEHEYYCREWEAENFDDLAPDYVGDFTSVRVNDKPIESYPHEVQASFNYFLRSYEAYGRKRLHYLVNQLAFVMKNLEELHEDMIRHYYGLSDKQPTAVVNFLEGAVTEYYRWITFIANTAGVKDIIQLSMKITKKDNPTFILKTEVFRALVDIRKIKDDFKTITEEGQNILAYLDKKDTQSFYHKQHFADLLLRLNKLFVLNVSNKDLRYDDVIQNIPFITALAIDSIDHTKSHARNARELKAEIIGLMEEKLETADKPRLKNTTLKSFMIATFKRIAQLKNITDFNDSDLFKDIQFSYYERRINRPEVIAEDHEEDGNMLDPNAQLVNTNVQHNIPDHRPDVMEHEPDEESEELVPFINTYRFQEQPHVYHQEVPQKTYRMKDLENWLYGVIFNLSTVRELTNHALKSISLDHTLENISHYRLKLLQLLNNHVHHHQFLQHVKGLSEDDLVNILGNEYRQIEVNPTAFQQKYPNGSAFCVANHGIVKLHHLKEDDPNQKMLKAINKIDIGYPYRSILQTLPFIQDEQVEFVNAQKSTYYLLLRNSKDVTAHIKDVLNQKVIMSVTSDMPNRDDESWYHSATTLYAKSFIETLETPLKSGWKTLEVDGAIDYETKLTLVCEQPYPATILKVAAKAKLLQEYR